MMTRFSGRNAGGSSRRTFVRKRHTSPAVGVSDTNTARAFIIPWFFAVPEHRNRDGRQDGMALPFASCRDHWPWNPAVGSISDRARCRSGSYSRLFSEPAPSTRCKRQIALRRCERSLTAPTCGNSLLISGSWVASVQPRRWPGSRGRQSRVPPDMRVGRDEWKRPAGSAGGRAGRRSSRASTPGWPYCRRCVRPRRTSRYPSPVPKRRSCSTTAGGMLRSRFL